MSGELLVPAAEQECAVGATETEGVGHGVFDCGFARVVWNQIHPSRVGVGVFEVDRGRQYLVAQREHRNTCFQSPGSAQQMPRHRFCGTHRGLVLAEEIADRVGFERVANRR
jgi:hypothetical protein